MVAGLARSNDFPLSSTTSNFSEYAHFSTVVDSFDASPFLALVPHCPVERRRCVGEHLPEARVFLVRRNDIQMAQGGLLHGHAYNDRPEYLFEIPNPPPTKQPGAKPKTRDVSRSCGATEY